MDSVRTGVSASGQNCTLISDEISDIAGGNPSGQLERKLSKTAFKQIAGAEVIIQGLRCLF